MLYYNQRKGDEEMNLMYVILGMIGLLGVGLVFGGGGACGAGEEDEFLPVYSNEKDGF